LRFLDQKCTFRQFSQELLSSCNTFDCGHTDLNDFFTNDCINYSNQLLGKTYCFTLDDNPHVIMCIFTISNDSIKANLLPKPRKNRLNRRIPNQKHLHSYPGVLIGRIGVNKNYKRRGIGRELMDFIKSWFIDSANKTGCRFVIVDSYNEEEPLGYYVGNGFSYLFENEDDEKKYTGITTEASLKTRLMYYDLIVLRS
jgi:GNAT superfamily N-acetyltransferase